MKIPKNLGFSNFEAQPGDPPANPSKKNNLPKDTKAASTQGTFRKPPARRTQGK